MTVMASTQRHPGFIEAEKLIGAYVRVFAKELSELDGRPFALPLIVNDDEAIAVGGTVGGVVELRGWPYLSVGLHDDDGRDALVLWCRAEVLSQE